MSNSKSNPFMTQFKAAKRAVAKLRKQYPDCFDSDGRAIVAVAAFPRRVIKEPTNDNN